MDDQPAKMDGYIRVSRVMGREGPGYISPEVQRDDDRPLGRVQGNRDLRMAAG